MKCPKCGNEIINDSLFCEYCGTPIKIDNTKHVDIRWALLPAMFLATIMIATIWGIGTCHMYICYKILPLTIYPVILFIITLWYGIKRKVAISFVIIMGLFLISNCGMLYESLNRHVFWETSMDVSWDENAITRTIRLSTEVNTDEHNRGAVDEYDRAEKLIRSCQQDLYQKLKEEGKSNVEASGIVSSSPYCETSGRSWLETYIPIMFVLSLLYIIYAYWVPRKGWKF